jgi:hypothetical protein
MYGNWSCCSEKARKLANSNIVSPGNGMPAFSSNKAKNNVQYPWAAKYPRRISKM